MKLKDGNLYINIISRNHSTIIPYSSSNRKWALTQAKCFNKMFLICNVEKVWPENQIKCQFLNCIAGMGLAGRGMCFLNGEADNSECPFFEKDII